MKPNIFLILLDSLRADTIFGEHKSCKTPNIDQLISHGTSFTNAFSSADHTGVSWLSIIRGIFPLKNNINPYKFDSKFETFIEIFKENNFKTFCFFPDISFFKILAEKFDNSILYEYSNRDEYTKRKNDRINELIRQIKNQNSGHSNLTCIHLMDLKYPYVIPTEFDNNNFGKNRQDRMLSYLDKMLGEIINSINPKNSIIVFSSDHGDYIPITGHDIDEIPRIQKIFRKGKQTFPSLEPVGSEVFKFLKQSAKKVNTIKDKKNFSSLEQRGFLNRNESFLFDDTLNVPLIFLGNKVKNQKISALVRHIDIFPTICKFLDLTFDESKYDGKNILVSSFSNQNDLIAYFESGPANENLKGKVIGIRTAKFKYFRSRTNKTENPHLYNLSDDQYEEHNIAETMPELVSFLENELSKLGDTKNEKNELKRMINKKISKLKLD